MPPETTKNKKKNRTKKNGVKCRTLKYILNIHHTKRVTYATVPYVPSVVLLRDLEEMKELALSICFPLLFSNLFQNAIDFNTVWSKFDAKNATVYSVMIVLICLYLVAIVFAFRYYRGTPSGRLMTDRMFLKLPLVGKTMRKIAISRFTQTFGSATHGGIPILKALAVSANVSGNQVIKNAVMQVATHVQEGTALAPPLDATGEFPPLVIRMIAAGEKSAGTRATG